MTRSAFLHRVFVCLWIGIGALAGYAQPQYVLCHTAALKPNVNTAYKEQGMKTAYFSAPFLQTAPAPREGESYNQQFLRFLQQKYNFDRSIQGCTSFSTLDQAVAAMNNFIQTEAPVRGLIAVQTGWAPGSAAAVAEDAPSTTAAPATPGAPGAAQPAPSADTRYEFCQATDSNNVYYSAPFTGNPPAGKSDAGEFGNFLKQKYNVHRYVTCNSFPTRDQVVAAMNDQIRVHPSLHFVETGWVRPAAVAGGASPGSTAAAPASGDPCASTTLSQRAPPPGCGNTPTVSYVVCSVTDASPTAYVSATFQVTAMDNPGWINAFAQFLAQKYGHRGGGVGCNVIHEDAAQTFLKGRVMGLRANGKTVVETGWTFGSAPAVPLAAAPPAPAPANAVTPRSVAVDPAPEPPVRGPVPAAPKIPQKRYATCFGRMLPSAPGSAGTVYASAPFDASAGTHPEWAAQFKQMLQEKYGFRGGVSCQTDLNLPAAQATIKRNLALALHYKTVETDWTYK